jgi:magnesium transporter
MGENYLETSFQKVWRKRAGWLAVLFGAELFTFTALTYFEDEIKAVVVLSLSRCASRRGATRARRRPR